MVKEAKEISKPWWTSRTVWIAVLTILGGMITALAGELQAGGAITAIGIMNIILRVITTTAIK